MAVGRISGPLLKANLLRNGVNLAFETDLLYLDVVNGRIGVKTSAPQYELDVNGTTRTTNLEVTTQANIATFTVTDDTIASSSGTINLTPSGTNSVVYQGKLLVNGLEVSANTIQTITPDTDLTFETLGTGQVVVNSNMLVNGDLHATGNITADGDITIGNENTDSITLNADIASNIIPDQTNFYNIGSLEKTWAESYINDIFATNIVADTITINGVNLLQPQGNIFYVSTTGNDAGSGIHEHDPYLTIKYALSQASAGDLIYIYPGEYFEIFPITIPSGVTVKGAGIRAVSIRPTVNTLDKDAFLINGETTIEDLSIVGYQFNSVNNTGYALRFANGFTATTRSPYIRNVTVITKGTPTELSVNDFILENNGSIERIKEIIDELVINTTIVVSLGNSAIQIKDLTKPSDASTGLILQALFDDVLYVINNGPLISELPTIVPNGPLTTDAVKLNASALINSNIGFLKAEMVAWVNAYQPGFWSTYSQATAERDLGIILDAVAYDIVHGGNEKSIAAGIGFWKNPLTDPYGFDSDDAGKGMFLDGSVANINSKEASCLFHSVTFITPNQETITATNGVRIEWLNSFSYFADKGMYLYSSPEGFAGAGLTRLRINNRTGSWVEGDTLTYYDTDGISVLASGTINSIDGNYVNLTGRALGFQSVTDRVGKVVYVAGDAKLSTVQKKFGTASLLLDGTGDYINLATTTDFEYSTNNFTIEFWIYRNSNAGTQTLFDQRTGASSISPTINIESLSDLQYLVGGVVCITGTGAVPNLNQWYHIAVSRSGTDTKMFVDGTQVGLTYTDTNNYIQGPIYLGSNFLGAETTSANFDDLRVSKNVARYTGNFISSTVALNGDVNTVLLLHFNGANNSTTILDDGVSYQDLRTSSGGTANLINFADYSDFGVEIRSIGSANIYGNYGAYGDGEGIVGYLISQNFAYVGTGKLSTNDPNDQIPANEVIELNGAHIYRTSVDNDGNFKVGNYFYVNQKTGEVLFNDQSLNIASLTGVTFTNGTNVTTITPADITTGNLRIYDNNIDSLVGNIIVTAEDGNINLDSNTFVTGNLDVTGNVTIGGNITIGDQSSDTINFVGGISSNLVPATNEFYDIGEPNYRWNNAFLSRVEIDSLVIDNNTISTTLNDDNLILTANGSGIISIPSNDVQIDQSLTVTQDLTVTTGTTYLQDVDVEGTITQIGDINQTGTFTTSGNTEVDGNITTTGNVELPQITISNNSITTTTTDTDLVLTGNGTGGIVTEDLRIVDNKIESIPSNTNIVLQPQGSGIVVIDSTQSLQIPVGTSAQQPVGSAGMLRYNTDLIRYEGYNGSTWIPLGGVQDLDGNTYITAESTPGLNDGILSFYANGNLIVTIDDTHLYTDTFQTDNINITGNTISSINVDSDVILSTTGTGEVILSNLSIKNNTITNNTVNAVTEFVQTGTGYVKIAGTNGIVLPSGNSTTDRPMTPEIGMTRFNTELGYVEVWKGTEWDTVVGDARGVTTNEANDLGILTAILFG